MIRVGVLLALLLLMPMTRAFAGDLRPVCETPSVLEVMARELHKRDYYIKFEPHQIAEVPDAAPNSVWCGITVWRIGYDARIADGLPILSWEQHAFRIQVLSNGFVVRYLG